MTTPEAPSPDALLSRIAALERTVTTLTRTLLVCAVAAFGLVGLFWLGMEKELVDIRGELGGMHGALFTRGIAIVDKSGQIRASLGTDDEGSTEFRIQGSPGQARIIMGTSSGPIGNPKAPDKPQFPYLWIWDENNKKVFDATR